MYTFFVRGSPNLMHKNGSVPCRKISSIAVTTHRVAFVPTNSLHHRVPLTIVDWHLHQEQLPFAYFFDEILDEHLLEESLRRALQNFPQTGGHIHNNSIECSPSDAVQLTFGRINRTLGEWKRKDRQHTHHGAGGNPKLLPIFDCLFQRQVYNQGNHSMHHGSECPALAKIRVTYFKEGATVIGVNFCHSLGDTSTCVHFVRSWGRLMRKESLMPNEYCDDRARATVGGMLTKEVAEIITPNPVRGSVNVASLLSIFFELVLQPWWTRGKRTKEESRSRATGHEYVRLSFSNSVIECMKAEGRKQSAPGLKVSTNDMLTAFGWLVKRKLANKPRHAISMVVNLRGRFGVSKKFFGNGLAHVIAELPESNSKQIGTDEVCRAATRIREALQTEMLDIPERLIDSRRGQPTPSRGLSVPSFGTTSWSQFPIWKVRFGNKSVMLFHGQPLYPLPPGQTFSSVILPDGEKGYIYELLLPCDKASEARRLYLGLSTLFIEAQHESRVTTIK